MKDPIPRRRFLSAVGLAVLGAVVCSCAMGRSLNGSSLHSRPNIVFILADDLGYGDLGCYGQKQFKTPHIDRLASEGMRFRQFYSGSTVCAPSRCSLMTGYHMGHSFIRGNGTKNQSHVDLRPQDFTVAELLKQQGYATGLFGKWGLGLEATTGEPRKKGFDEWTCYLDQTHAHFYYTDYVWKNGRKQPLAPGQYSHDLFVDEALDFVRRNRANPFFLYLAVTLPHASMEVPEDSMKKYRGQFPEKPFPGPHYSPQPEPAAAFAGMMNRLDRDVGRLLDCIKELGLDEDTLVFFTSDNGPHQEGGRDPVFFRSSGPLRGIKRDLYEGGIRVPALARWPGVIRPGSVVDEPMAFWDFLPTAAEMTGAAVPAGLDGISMLPLLRGKSHPSHEFLYWEFYERGFQQAIRMGDWKGVKLKSGQPMELYNLAIDPGEKTNVATAHPDILARLQARMSSARYESEIWPSRPTQ